MMARGFRKGHSAFEPPIEMRFVDLFMIIVAALMFITVMLSIISAFVGSARIDVAPQVATRTLPTALLSQPYSLTLAGTGGANPYTWAIATGALPDGLTLDPKTGTISGTPLRVQRAQFAIQLTDAEHRSDQREMVLNVANTGQQPLPTTPQLHVASDTIILPDALSNTAYRFRLSVNGGTPPYQWSLVQGKLPPDFHLTPSGDVVGTTSADNTSWTFVVKAIDANGLSVTQHVRLLVVPAPTPLWQTILSWVFTVLYFVWLAWLLLFGSRESSGIIGWLLSRRNR